MLQGENKRGRNKTGNALNARFREGFEIYLIAQEAVFYDIALTGSHEVRGSIPLDSTN
jgi:hypothetical protein